MMKHLSPVLRSGLVAGAVALLPLTEAAATGGDGGVTELVPTIPGASPERSCKAYDYSGKKVEIIAGPNTYDNSLTPSAVFPVKVTTGADPNCKVRANPSDPNSQLVNGTCLRWDYRWLYSGVSPSYSFATLDSDLVLNNALGGPVTSPPKVYKPVSGGDDVAEGVAEVRLVRFNAANGAAVGGVFNASLYTGVDARVGKVTAGFRSGDRKGFCGIQGPKTRRAAISCSPSPPLRIPPWATARLRIPFRRTVASPHEKF